MSTHVYPKQAIWADYGRAGVGIAFTLGPVLFAEMLSALQVIFLAIGLLFAGYLLRTWQRASTTVEVDAGGVRLHGPLGAAIDWSDLSELALAYYSTRRDRNGGWMQLVMRDDRNKITIDSNLEGFDEVLRRCTEMARRNDVALSETTVENLQAAGIETAPGGPPGA